MGRLRFNKNATNIINNSPYLLHSYEDKFFQNADNRLYIEIGMGKGDFIINNALLYPNINFIGVEKYPTVLAKAIKKLEDKYLVNLKLMCTNALELNKIFKPHSVDKIFLNFSDPWPKARHEKRRLTSNPFLDIYKIILKDDGLIEFKTDNSKLYQWSLETLKANEEIEILYFCDNIYLDLNNPYNLNNIQTEYEKKFVSLNISIKKIVFKFK